MELVKNSVIKYGESKKQENLLILDMDGTLIRPKSKTRKFPIDASDWCLIYENAKEKIRELGWQTIIVTNQLKATNAKTKTRARLNKMIPAVIDELGGDIECYMLVARDSYRKPATSVLEEYIKPHKYKQCIFVGDAAGRVEDHGRSDIDFVFNYNILHDGAMKFQTPEQFFYGARPISFPQPEFMPYEYFDNLRGGRDLADIKHDLDFMKIDKPEAVYICGPPKCGKSELANRIAKEWGYTKIMLKGKFPLNPKKSYIVDINAAHEHEFTYKHPARNRIIIMSENNIRDEYKVAIVWQCIIAAAKLIRAPLPKVNPAIEYYETRSFPKWNCIKLPYELTITSEQQYKYLCQLT